MNCNLPKGIKADGWDNWRNPENEKTVRYAEYNNSGEGAEISGRVKWVKQLSRKEAEKLTANEVFKIGNAWFPLN
jgi:pectinesterase